MQNIQSGDFIFDRRQLKIALVHHFVNEPQNLFVYHYGFKGILPIDKNCFKINLEDYPEHYRMYKGEYPETYAR